VQSSCHNASIKLRINKYASFSGDLLKWWICQLAAAAVYLAYSGKEAHSKRSMTSGVNALALGPSLGKLNGWRGSALAGEIISKQQQNCTHASTG